MTGENILEALSFDIFIQEGDDQEMIGPIIQDIEKALVKPGWSALRQVSISVKAQGIGNLEVRAEMEEDLQSLAENYLSQLLEVVELRYKVDIW